jgi:hypothetical protein
VTSVNKPKNGRYPSRNFPDEGDIYKLRNVAILRDIDKADKLRIASF